MRSLSMDDPLVSSLERGFATHVNVRKEPMGVSINRTGMISLELISYSRDELV
jgi:hypothetical protein